MHSRIISIIKWQKATRFIFRGYSISPDNSKAAYFYNETGSYAEFKLKIKDLASGEEVGFTVDGAASVAWANDNKTYSTALLTKRLLISHHSPTT